MRNNIDVQETPYPGITQIFISFNPIVVPKHKLYHLNVINERTFGEKIGKIVFKGIKVKISMVTFDLNISRFSLLTYEVKGNLINFKIISLLPLTNDHSNSCSQLYCNR